MCDLNDRFVLCGLFRKRIMLSKVILREGEVAKSKLEDLNQAILTIGIVLMLVCTDQLDVLIVKIAGFSLTCDRKWKLCDA